MIDHDLGQFLTEDELTLLQADRKMTIARTLMSQAHLLSLYGSGGDHIRDNVANMRATFSQLSIESIQKVQKSIADHTLALVGVQPVAITPPETLPLETGREIEVEKVDFVGEIERPAVQVQNEIPSTVEQPQALVVETMTITQDEFDEAQPKELSPQVNNLFKRLLPFEQREAIPTFSSEQKEALVDLMGRVYEKGALRPEEGPKQMNRLRRLLNGDTAKDIAKDDGVDATAIGNAFRVSMPGLYFRHKHEVAQGFADILAMQPVQVVTEETVSAVIENEQEQVAPAVEVAEAVFERSKPGDVSIALKNLFRLTLTEEQCIELSYFNEVQTAEFFEVLKEIYSQRALKKSYIPMQLNRIKLALNGANFDEIAHNEGSQKNTVRQSFYVSLAEFFAAHKGEIIAAFERIRGAKEPEVTTSLNGSHLHYEEQPSETAEVTPSANEVQFDQAEVQQEEELTSLMLAVYGTNDPEARKGVFDLFSVKSGVIEASEQSIEAAHYLVGLIQRNGISLSASINDSTVRSSVERLLYGLPDGESRKWSTFSEILAETPDVFRGNKLRKVSSAFDNIARQIERPSLVKEDPREKQVEALRAELHTWTGLPQEITGRIIDRALEKEVEFTGELGKALLQMYQVAAGVGLDEKELNIMRLFVIPRPGSSPRSIAEIREVLKRDQNKHGISMKQLENGYVSSMLLRSFDKIIVQRRDG